MSRLCVKNVPDYVNEARLKKHFESKGVVTDVKVVRNQRGESRKMAFIGFRSEKEGKAAMKYFDNTYIDTCKIAVELAKRPGDESLPRPWSRYSKGSSAYEKSHPEEAKAVEKTKKTETGAKQDEKKKDGKEWDERQKSIIEKLKLDQNDPKLKEFLSVMQPRKHDQFFWANDDANVLPAPAKVKSVSHEKVASKKAGGEGVFLERSHIKFEDDEEEGVGSEDELYNEIPNQGRYQEAQEKLDEKALELNKESVAYNTKLSDLDYLKSKMKKSAQEKENEEEENEEEENDDEEENDKEESDDDDHQDENGGDDEDKAKIESRAEPNSSNPKQPNPFDQAQARMAESSDDSDSSDEEETAAPEEKDQADDTGRLYVTNFPYSATESELKRHFRKYGEVSEVHIVMDKDSKKSKGYAFVQYMIPENAHRALKELHNSIFEGRILKVVAANKMPEKKENKAVKKDGLKSDFQRKKEEEKKESANKDINWNTLFMSSNAIADSIAHKYGIKKSDLLDASADNIAVRLALAETQIINETKTMLEEEGVSLESFTNYVKKERSNVVILVKNIPFSTEESDLRSLFDKFGNIGRLVLPPTKTIALIEFLQPNDAKVAFKSLAYTKFKELPLYLEWAPLNVFSKPASEKKSTQGDPKSKKLQEDVAENPSIPQEGQLESHTLYVKNLNFKTSEESLRRTFENIPGFRKATVATKKVQRKKPTGDMVTENQSLGFGFVEFSSKDAATKALKDLQGHSIDGYAISLQFSTVKSSENAKAASAKDDATNKLIVRNVPFEATKKDLKQLFGTFGTLKSLRLPRKFDGQHRGFAFIEFVTVQEAKTAMEALKSTHLYGRHLVSEYSKDDESIETLRQKTIRYFDNQTETGSKSKKQKLEDMMKDNGSDDEYE